MSSSITDYPLTNPVSALFLLSPCHVDDVRGERRRPRPDDSSAPTTISGARRVLVLRADAYTFNSIKRDHCRRRRARTRPGEHDSHDLPDAHHPNPFALPSSPQTTPRSLPEVDARRNTWPQFRRRREHFALPGPRLPTYTVPPTTTPPTNVSVRDGDMRRGEFTPVRVCHDD